MSLRAERSNLYFHAGPYQIEIATVSSLPFLCVIFVCIAQSGMTASHVGQIYPLHN